MMMYLMQIPDYSPQVGEGRGRAGDDGAGEGLRVARRARPDDARRARGGRGPLLRQDHGARRQPLFLLQGLPLQPQGDLLQRG